MFLLIINIVLYSLSSDHLHNTKYVIVQRCDVKRNKINNLFIFGIVHEDKNTHLSPVDQILKNEQGVAHQQVDGIYFAGQYRRLSFSSRKTKRTNLRAVNASARLCWHLFTSLYLRW